MSFSPTTATNLSWEREVTKPQQRGAETETEKVESSSTAPALHVLRGRGRSITMHIWHSQPFHGVTCVLLAGSWNDEEWWRLQPAWPGRETSVRPDLSLEPGPSRARYFPRDMLLLTKTPRAVVVNSNMSRGKNLEREGPGSRLAQICTPTVHGFDRELRPGKSARSAGACLPSIGKEGADCRSKGIFLPMGDHGILGSLRRAFSPLWRLSRHCKWLTSVDRYPSTMERKLVVGIRDFCILSSWKACLEGKEKEKLTREVLSVLMVAQKSTRRRVEWIKWGLFTVGFFFWSTPHCTVCPARWLVSSSSVCKPSSDPFVKSHRSPSSFTPCNIFFWDFTS